MNDSFDLLNAFMHIYIHTHTHNYTNAERMMSKDKLRKVPMLMAYTQVQVQVR